MTLRKFVQRLAQVAAATGFSAVMLASDPLVTNVPRFDIPFDIDVPPGQPMEGFAVLFGSTDGGGSWEKLQTVPVAQKGFPFVATRDGHYSFAVRMTDPKGNLQAPESGYPPELEIVVDTAAPALQLAIEPAGPGQAMIRWSTADASVVPQSFVLEYSDATDGRWNPVAVVPVTSGQTLIATQPGSVLSARASILDTAGNRGEYSAQLMVPASNPAPVFPAASAPPAPPASSIGPSPFAPAASGAPAAFAPQPTVQPQQTSPPADVPTMPDLPNPQLLPQSGPPAFAADSAQRSGPAHLLNSPTFELSYQVEDIGPSGVSAVEIFVTEDGGENWFRYGNDTDLRSPAQVDVQGEGTFGFSIRVRSGLGLINVPPQPGEAPDITVTVDQTAPQIEFHQPAIRPEGNGVVAMNWQILEPHPVPAPVRLEKSESPTGPWTPVFDWQADQSGRDWAVEPGAPATLYFRLLARDAAGNVASATTPQPVLIDLRRPVAKVIGAQVSSVSSQKTSF